MYLNVAEIESAITNLQAAYPTTAEILIPPHPTHENRTARLLRIGSRPADTVDGILILGGVHAREWVPPDALVSLAADLLDAHSRGTGLGYGSTSYTAAQVTHLIDGLNLFLYPCVNPDGRAFSQTTNAMWRKNRRPAPAGPGHSGPSCAGVDLNRNFDFLWDHTAKFAPDADVHTSGNPCDPQMYRGPSAASEPETRNVVWALDTHPRIRWLVDVHSAVPVILHNWGSDRNQSTSPTDNFRNPALDAVRGRKDDNIGEFIPHQDLKTAVELAERMNDAVHGVRGVDYGVEAAYGLYPTSGTSDDYAYSRHFTTSAATKTLGYTIECGTSFQPPYREAEHVIREVSAALMALALNVR
ncbi:M14 family metallopeptidase [Streptomyces sp. SP18BB07]|uniref:M14 family metallopeptidase n=1 Tax=Streptomyces sp. SP18BB07 TaxID=3002522 RepID=UPI002E7A1194|nr:M14 family metallopeptidase [Streptomyces sp. SP18BB07]MEE1765098.1 M14 family metallopeptidase [Streptomyces sp. SP18BB07]